MPQRLSLYAFILAAWFCLAAATLGQSENYVRKIDNGSLPVPGRTVSLRVDDHADLVIDEAAFAPPPLPDALTEYVVPHTVTSHEANLVAPSSASEVAVCQCDARHGHTCCPPARWNVTGRLHAKWTNHWKPCLQKSHWGYREEFCERPFGSSVRANLCAQIGNGLRDQLILYRFDFVDDTLPQAHQLKPRGRYELAKIVTLLQQRPVLQCDFNLVIVEETQGRPGLNEARRRYVLEELARMEFPLPPEQVVVSRSTTPGISGDEAIIIYENLQKLWENANRSSSQSSRSSVGLFSGAGLGNSGSNASGR